MADIVTDAPEWLRLVEAAMVDSGCWDRRCRVITSDWGRDGAGFRHLREGEDLGALFSLNPHAEDIPRLLRRWLESLHPAEVVAPVGYGHG